MRTHTLYACGLAELLEEPSSEPKTQNNIKTKTSDSSDKTRLEQQSVCLIFILYHIYKFCIRENFLLYCIILYDQTLRYGFRCMKILLLTTL